MQNHNQQQQQHYGFDHSIFTVHLLNRLAFQLIFGRPNDIPLCVNSVAFSQQENYTERPPLVGEVSANFCG
jgi:hypothetical protein